MKTIQLKWHLTFLSPIPNRPHCGIMLPTVCLIGCISVKNGMTHKHCRKPLFLAASNDWQALVNPFLKITRVN